jgi:LacI family transcriptional regulator
MLKTPRVLLLVESSGEYGRKLRDGIGRYALEHGPWSIFLEDRGRHERMPPWIRAWDGDGIIARSSTPEMVRVLLKTGVPVVEADTVVSGFDLPLVYTSDAITARLAADHFLDRGLKHVAYCNFSGAAWSRLRGDAFAANLANRGIPCALLDDRLRGGDWARQQAKLAGWLRALPKPVGIFAENDVCGHRLLDTCRLIGIPVPDQVAVLGVDNDESLCRLTSPPLSSIDPNTQRIGYEAAALLDRMMAGQKPPREPILVEPLTVVARQSTDVLAVEDRDVAEAVRYIRANACKGITVKDVLAVVSISRRVLEQRFQVFVGRTPKEEIMRARLNRARELLAQSEFPIAQVAKQSGFSTTNYLANVFRRELNTSPRQYRRAARSPH